MEIWKKHEMLVEFLVRTQNISRRHANILEILTSEIKCCKNFAPWRYCSSHSHVSNQKAQNPRDLHHTNVLTHSKASLLNIIVWRRKKLFFPPLTWMHVFARARHVIGGSRLLLTCKMLNSETRRSFMIKKGRLSFGLVHQRRDDRCYRYDFAAFLPNMQQQICWHVWNITSRKPSS